MAAETNEFSPVEGFKQESNYLAGDIGAELVDDSDKFGKGSVQLLKHHGTYQQDNRDVRGGGQKSYIFMVRTKLPGGELTSKQLLAELDLCDDVGNTTLRITSRQGLQLHGVLKTRLRETIARIDETQMTTLGACGDVNRNVMCCPAPYANPVSQAIQQLSRDLGSHFAPRTSSYHQIWLTDTETGEKKVAGAGADVEPIYGDSYLPRKFKMGIALPHDNCIDVYTHDLGFVAVIQDGQLIGYNVIAGGGQGVTPASKKTFPALGRLLCFVPPAEAVEIAEAVVKVQRDNGNRSDRKQARLKYLIHNWGMDRFRSTVEEYYAKKLESPNPTEPYGFNDHMGWEQQGDGKWFYGLNVENGRVADTTSMKLKTAIREICTKYEPGLRLTSHQSILFTDVDEEDKTAIEETLTKHQVPLSKDISNARRWSMACVAWPTCGLSITESERALPGMIDQLDVELAKLGLEEEKFTIRMTGCPNGCARPYNSDIGLVGKAKGKYTLYVGGRLLGDRLSFIHKDLLPADDVVPSLTALFTFFKESRQEGETFGDFCHRKGNEELLAWTEQNV